MSDFLDQFDKVPVSQKVLLLILLMLGIFVAYFFALQSPLDEELANQEQRVQTLNTQRTELHAGTEDIDRIRGEIADLCERRETFLEKLPPREAIPNLLQSINQQAELTGLTIERFERRVNLPGPTYTTIPVAMALKGSYDQISDFFYFIGRQQRIVNVSDISLTVPAAGGGWRLSEGQARANELGWFMAGDEQMGAPELTIACTLRTYFVDGSAASGGDACAQ